MGELEPTTAEERERWLLVFGAVGRLRVTLKAEIVRRLIAQVNSLEARLARAVEALEEMQRHMGSDEESATESLAGCAEIADRLLAELRGQEKGAP
jgi:cell division septum initiation protein DivIVA